MHHLILLSNSFIRLSHEAVQQNRLCQSMRTMPVLTGPGAELITFEGTNHAYDAATAETKQDSRALPSQRSIILGKDGWKPAMYRWGFGAATVFNRNGFLQFHNPINHRPTKKKAAKRGLESALHAFGAHCLRHFDYVVGHSCGSGVDKSAIQCSCAFTLSGRLF